MTVVPFLLILQVLSVRAIPGLVPSTYCKTAIPGKCESRIDVFAARMDSAFSVVAYSPEKFDQCTAEGTYKPAENFGEIVFGQRLSTTGFQISFAEPVECKALCVKQYKDTSNKYVSSYNDLLSGIKSYYDRHWFIDSLPVTVCHQVADKEKSVCERSIPLGCLTGGGKSPSQTCEALFGDTSASKYFLLNHFDFKIRYAPQAPDGQADAGNTMGKIIAAEVTPRSILHNGDKLDCSSNAPLVLPFGLQSPLDITYSYSVTFEEVKDVSWTSRWDYLLASSPSHTNIQWLSIVNSLIVVIFLTGLVALVLVRTLYRDVSRYNKLDSSGNEAQEEFGWKLVHGDVFRAPSYPMLLSVFVGSGTQLALMAVITLFFACFGILSPAHRGAFGTCALAVFVCLGASAGYVSARLYKFFGGLCWKTNVLATALFCPGIVVTVFLTLNVVLSALHSSMAVSFTTILALLAMWLLVSLPLSAIGAFFGFRKDVITVPTRTNQIPRQIPPQACYTRFIPSVLLAGLLPFGCIFIQLFFIFNSIWGHQLFFMFGLLFIIFLVLLNYKWYWRSFVSSGSTALFVVLYSFHYYVTKTEYKGFVSAFLYFSYTTLVASLLFLLLGSVGFLACFLFIRKIYSVVKVD
nr:unnamed protein product [Spirometra erinaceieuropaei]